VSGRDLLSRRLLLFTGKGGVGKSTVAAATAVLAADRGKRVLLVEVDDRGSVTSLFERDSVGFQPVEVYPEVFALQVRTQASMREYLRVNLRVPLVGTLGPLEHALDFLANAAPGVKEVLTIGKVCWEVREALEGRARWDLVVVDAAATGHVVAQLDSPRAIQELVHVGPIRAQTEWMTELLADPDVTALNVVTSGEEMPVNETIELVGRARQMLQVPLGVVVVNKVLPALFTRAESVVYERMRAPDARARLTADVGTGAGAVVDAARLAVALRTIGTRHLARLGAAVDLPLVYLPYLFVREHGLRVTRMLADALGAELDP
jgi:anion-transporting  ArsA/GET3 family ATPase